MWKKIFFVVASLAIGVVVLAISVTMFSEQKQLELLKDAFATSNYEAYLAYNTPYYSKETVYFNNNSDFQIKTYKFVGELNEKAFVGYTIFINNLNEDKFKVSEEMYDENDKTNMIVEADGEEVYNYTSEVTENSISLTYGYSQFQGFYFVFLPESSKQYTVKLFDYDGTLFDSFNIIHEENIDRTKSIEEQKGVLETDLTLKEGYTKQTQVQMVIKKINTVMAIYAIVVVAMFFLVFGKSIIRAIKKKMDKEGN